MSRLVVTGYASLDYPVTLAGSVQTDQTTRITHRHPDAWPRVGGSPFYVGAAAHRAGMDVTPITWTGDDAPGHVFRDACARAGLSTQGVFALEGRRSPVCLLLHQYNESTACLFDPAFPGEETLTERQIDLLSNCSHACVTVGPSHLIEHILELVPTTAALYWVAKKDVTAFPSESLAGLKARACVIFCNRGERDWVGQGDLKDNIVVETLGAEGCRVCHGAREDLISASLVETADPTGAGDTFAGGFIGAFSNGADPVEAAKSGTQYVQEMLSRRKVDG